MDTATGTFDIVSGSEEPYREAPGEVKLTHANGTQKFSGDLSGDGSIEWLMCYLPEGGAHFVGLQRIEGSLCGHRGSFVMEAVGQHTGTSSKATWRVIPGSGTGDLAGLSGEGAFDAPGGKTVSYRLAFEIG
jgi:Protein of unknown function (DUF3224)